MKKLIIVGAGITGLAAGVYALQSGFDVTIYESHSIPGGNSTSWKRKGYLFEGGMHWLSGSTPKAPLYREWQEVGALQENNPIHNRDPFLTYMGNNETINLYRDANKLKQHLLKVSPQDKQAIHSLIKDIKAFAKVAMPIMDMKGVRVKKKVSMPLSLLFRFMRILPRMKKLNKITVEQYLKAFKNPNIRTLLSSVVGEEYYATALMFSLGNFAAYDSGYPQGGSLRMARNMADRFSELGGEIKYNSKVERIIVEDERAVGIITDGNEYQADSVIVTSDTLTAIDKFFTAPLNEPWTKEMRENVVPLSCTFLSLGIKADLTHLPENVILPIKTPFTFAGKAHNELNFNNYASYPGYAPSGCTVITMAFTDDNYDAWKSSKNDGTYDSKKKELAELVIDRLSQAIPIAKEAVEVYDVATPLTYERYCGTYKGSWMSITNPQTKREQFPNKSETIKNLYFAGQRTQLPGGLPVAILTAKQAVQYLCRDTKMIFQGNQADS